MVRNSVLMVYITFITPRIHGFAPRNTAENNQCIILHVDVYIMN